MKRFYLAIFLIFGIPNQLLASEKTSILIDHDGGIDDYLAVGLQLLAQPDQIKAITIVPADSYLIPALWSTERILQLFHPKPSEVKIGISEKEGTNPFPAIWRSHAWNMARMDFWKTALPFIKESPENLKLQNYAYAPKLIVDTLISSKERFDLLLTGPFTHLAEALQLNPNIKPKIRRVYAMGGAVKVKGNVEEKGHDGSAEWNIYNNPLAAKTVVESGVDLTLIPLDATQYTPISKELQERIKARASEVHYGLFASSLKEIQPVIDDGSYFFWDTLTSAAFIDPSLVKTQKMQILVVTKGPSRGKTMESTSGSWVQVATWADQKKFEEKIVSLLEKFKIR